jgi:hypothetical protein
VFGVLGFEDEYEDEHEDEVPCALSCSSSYSAVVHLTSDLKPISYELSAMNYLPACRGGLSGEVLTKTEAQQSEDGSSAPSPYKSTELID